MSAEILSSYTQLPLNAVQDVFCNETGYQTPKVDVRAVIIQDQRILLVQEGSNGLWSLPGGWAEVDHSLAENAVKEVREEAGLTVRAERILAIQDRNRHNLPPMAWGIYKIYVLCQLLGGSFQPNSETLASGFFSLDDLPPLSTNRVTRAQLEMCFEAAGSSGPALFD